MYNVGRGSNNASMYDVLTFSDCIRSAVCLRENPFRLLLLTDSSSSPGQREPSSYAGVR